MAAAVIPLFIAAVSAGTTIYSTQQANKSAKKARQSADAIRQSADAIRQKEDVKIAAFRDRLQSGGRGLLGSSGDDDLGSTLGS